MAARVLFPDVVGCADPIQCKVGYFVSVFYITTQNFGG